MILFVSRYGCPLSLTKDQQQGNLSRVHNDKDEPAGNYLNSTEEVKGVTRAELRDSLALPKSSTAQYQTDYKGDKDRQVMVGKIGENDFWGKNSTKTQIKINEVRPENEEFYGKFTKETEE